VIVVSQYANSILMKRIILTILSLLLLVYIAALLVLGFKIPWVISLLPILAFVTFIGSILFSNQIARWIKILFFCVTIILVGLLFESIGVATGLVYGPYHYTDRLGQKFLNLVPIMIPAAWMVMMYPSMVIAKLVIPAAWSGSRRILSVAALSGIIMTAWDVVMDPMMVHGGNWVWEVRGWYFGIPLINFWGWWLTAFIAVLVFQLFTRKMKKSIPLIPDRWAVFIYCFIGLISIITCMLVKLEGAALAGILAMLPWMAAGWLKTSNKNNGRV